MLATIVSQDLESVRLRYKQPIRTQARVTKFTLSQSRGLDGSVFTGLPDRFISPVQKIGPTIS